MSFELLSLLAEEHTQFVVDPGIIALLIPILAIVMGFTAMIVKSIIHHRERMAKIGMGIDPDAPRPQAGQGYDPSRFGG